MSSARSWTWDVGDDCAGTSHPRIYACAMSRDAYGVEWLQERPASEGHMVETVRGNETTWTLVRPDESEEPKEEQSMDSAATIKELIKWLPVAWKMRSLFSGDKRKALRALRAWELDMRKARDRRMGRD